ncbi:replication protein A 70 kDa DNA-binding subunit E-like [Bidens hawaiensis]|uniref:replication protein A 70 kDa DNA-binding subunit E-like n=1 Tax=Bidens hawaiensis TaxID=980011 RepID=UPI00404B5BE7
MPINMNPHTNILIPIWFLYGEYWWQCFSKNEFQLSALDVSTLDATIKGTKIQAIVINAYLSKHERFLVEKECVLIQKFAIGDNLCTYRLTNHPHKLFLNDNSVVKRCNDPVGSLYGFSFIDFEMLLNNSLTRNSVVDIIGYVYTYFDMVDHKTKNGQLKKKMNLQVRDSELRTIFVTLWESFAEKMSDFMSQNPDGVTAIMILQFGRFTYSSSFNFYNFLF